jgi:hypothetical protein
MQQLSGSTTAPQQVDAYSALPEWEYVVAQARKRCRGNSFPTSIFST